MTQLRLEPERSASVPVHRRRIWVERNADRLIPGALGPHRDQVLYLAVGAWNTAFGYCVFAVLYFVAGDRVGSTTVLVASYVVAIFSAYLGYRYVAFRSHQSVLRELPRFAGVYVLTLIVNVLFFPIMLRGLPWSPYVVQALFTVGVVIVSYVGHRHFSFRVRAADPAPSNFVARPGRDMAYVADAEDPLLEGE